MKKKDLVKYLEKFHDDIDVFVLIQDGTKFGSFVDFGFARVSELGSNKINLGITPRESEYQKKIADRD